MRIKCDSKIPQIHYKKGIGNHHSGPQHFFSSNYPNSQVKQLASTRTTLDN
ncbi:hypothetical protein AAZX31_19G013500 [Glycine max]